MPFWQPRSQPHSVPQPRGNEICASVICERKKNISNYVYSPRGKENRRRTVQHFHKFVQPEVSVRDL